MKRSRSGASCPRGGAVRVGLAAAALAFTSLFSTIGAGVLSQSTVAPVSVDSSPRSLSTACRQRVVDQLATVVATCRQYRRPLSLLLVDPTVDRVGSGSAKMQKLLVSLCHEHQLPPASIIPLDESAWALLLPGFERRDAVSLAQELVLDPAPWQAWATELKVGIATLTVVAKGFEPSRMLTAAEGCLSAARASGGSLVKSIEVY